MRYKVIKWTRQLRIWLGGGKEREAKHYMFTLPRLLIPRFIASALWKDGWGYNVSSHTYKRQIFTIRKPDPPRHQWHLRFYEDGVVTGHYEVDPIQFPLEHLDGVDLRPLTEVEKRHIWTLLVGGS